MVWSFHCEACGMNLLAPTREELSEKVLRHGNQAHALKMTPEQAKKAIEEKATPEAA